ncbi:MAG: hypothetical protein OXB92_15500 [Acidimicrobiaceae bacterium]|nr:hypothetical protein [Acidimicrobiia bacterium]MCY4495249.1 hypothetical protein [Acidimicrobiaceae bacterium]
MTCGTKSRVPRRAGAVSVVVACLVLFASGCAGNNDPANWAEAEADGTLEENFMRSCQTANQGGDLTVAEAATYCECAYDGLAQHYADDFSGFKDAEQRLRNDPQDIDSAVLALFRGCEPQ